MLRFFRWTVCLLLSGSLTARATNKGSDAAAALDLAIASAESSLRKGELQIAESLYRATLARGWLLMGALETADGRLAEARDAFHRASTSTGENRHALHSLALAHLRMGEAPQAVEILTRLVGNACRDVSTLRLLAQAQVANGQPEEAVQTLEKARAIAPNDAELAYSLGAGYLRLSQPEAADRLFAQVIKQRPIPQTHVLLGRTYFDADEHARARSQFQAALRQNPRIRRAHYYLGLMIIDLEGTGIEELRRAIAEFKAELQIAPQDPLANIQLGMALVETRRFEEALPALEIATRSEKPEARAFYYLGRCYLGLDRPTEAVATWRRALELAEAQKATDAQLMSINFQLGTVLRKLGAREEAAAHLAESKRLADRRIDATREEITSSASNSADAERTASFIAPLIDAPPEAELPPSERLELKRRVTAVLARAYFNLGVLQAKHERFQRAAEMFEKASAVDAEFPQVQSSLGIARFKAEQFGKAIEPLTRALADNSNDAGLRRMLAMAHLNTQAYEQAAALLRDDPGRATNPELQFAYGLALVRSNRADEAEKVFSWLLTHHADWAELNVMLGQALADQEKYDLAILSLKRALEIKADVAQANATLGGIYLQQGRLAEAEEALRAELHAHPEDVQSQYDLAVILDSAQKPKEALPLLRAILRADPQHADARYRLGKILLGQGATSEAVEHLEAAARLSPEDANIRYQLGRAYLKQGQKELAQQQFNAFRELKAKLSQKP